MSWVLVRLLLSFCRTGSSTFTPYMDCNICIVCRHVHSTSKIWCIDTCCFCTTAYDIFTWNSTDAMDSWLYYGMLIVFEMTIHAFVTETKGIVSLLIFINDDSPLYYRNNRNCFSTNFHKRLWILSLPCILQDEWSSWEVTAFCYVKGRCHEPWLEQSLRWKVDVRPSPPLPSVNGNLVTTLSSKGGEEWVWPPYLIMSMAKCKCLYQALPQCLDLGTFPGKALY